MLSLYIIVFTKSNSWMVAPFRYGPSFQYAGDYIDKKDLDTFKRRKTRVIAIDAIPIPRMGQYKLNALIR